MDKGTEGGKLPVGLAKAKRTRRNCTREREGEVRARGKSNKSTNKRQRTSYGDR